MHRILPAARPSLAGRCLGAPRSITTHAAKKPLPRADFNSKSHANSNSKSQNKSQHKSHHESHYKAKPQHKPKPPKSPTTKRFVPEEAKKFVSPTGKLLTTPESESFFLEHGIEPDNGSMLRLSVRELGGTTTAAFSPRHVVAPYHLRYFDPRGHPLASAMRDRYRERSMTTPLWVMTTVLSGASPVVRATAARKIKRSLRASLDRLGYEGESGRGRGRQIRGTLWLTIANPWGIVAMGQARLGSGLAKILHEQHSSTVR